jgi:hypothetical protein
VTQETITIVSGNEPNGQIPVGDAGRTIEDAPVFVDRSGKRRRRIRLASFAVGGVGLSYVALIGVSLLGGPISPQTLLPDPVVARVPQLLLPRKVPKSPAANPPAPRTTAPGPGARNPAAVGPTPRPTAPPPAPPAVAPAPPPVSLSPPPKSAPPASVPPKSVPPKKSAPPEAPPASPTAAPPTTAPVAPPASPIRSILAAVLGGLGTS